MNLLFRKVWNMEMVYWHCCSTLL